MSSAGMLHAGEQKESQTCNTLISRCRCCTATRATSGAAVLVKVLALQSLYVMLCVALLAGLA
jgi:hypothetical protein